MLSVQGGLITVAWLQKAARSQRYEATEQRDQLHAKSLIATEVQLDADGCLAQAEAARLRQLLAQWCQHD